jgi:hypothetical protein
MQRPILLLCSLPVVLSLTSNPAGAQSFFGPTPYLSPADSPFPLGSGGFVIEDFEDHLVNSPGLGLVVGIVTSTQFSGSIIDSVDSDDGALGSGNCIGCDSCFSATGALKFAFEPTHLGGLPTWAGVVWTDGGLGSTVTFQAFDGQGVSLGTQVGTNQGDASTSGTTGEDRFYGVHAAGGIGEITIQHTGAGIEADHIQYDLPCPDAEALIYCTAKTNTLGCGPQIGFLGCPSATSPLSCTVVGSQFLNNKPGILIYSKQGASLPFQGGLLCVAAPFLRLGLGNSGGSAAGNDCSGAYALDFKALVQGGSDPTLTAGTTVFMQMWSRDPADPFGSSLSNGLRLKIGN